MDRRTFLKTLATKERLESSVEYVSEHMSRFVRRGERVMVCFPAEKETDLGTIFAEAVRRCGGVPEIWGQDHRWKTLLRQAFFCRAGAIIGPPLLILGLTKLSRAMATPLSIRHVLTAGYPCLDWMIEGIKNGLDCKSWGCLDLMQSGIIAGFSCGKSRGVHVREDAFRVTVLDDIGEPLSDGSIGNLVLQPVDDPQVSIPIEAMGSVERSACICGSKQLRILNISPGEGTDPELSRLGSEINQWSSVLDCRLVKTGAGLEIEIVVFPGERLPRLPSCAKLIVRPWNPEEDAPFWIGPIWKNVPLMPESH